jgi:hypothetical protein
MDLECGEIDADGVYHKAKLPKKSTREKIHVGMMRRIAHSDSQQTNWEGK